MMKTKALIIALLAMLGSVGATYAVNDGATVEAEPVTTAPAGAFNPARPDGWAVLMNPMNHGQFVNPATYVQFTQPDFYMQWADPAVVSQWVNPVAYQQFRALGSLHQARYNGVYRLDTDKHAEIFSCRYR